MGSAQKYNTEELEAIKTDLKVMIRREVIIWSAIFGTTSFIIWTYGIGEMLESSSTASMALTISYGADCSLALIDKTLHYFG